METEVETEIPNLQTLLKYQHGEILTGGERFGTEANRKVVPPTGYQVRGWWCGQFGCPRVEHRSVVAESGDMY